MSEDRLPPGYEDLERFVNAWALPTEQERVRKRYSSSMDEIREFYEAMLARVEEALEHLNHFSLDALPEKEKRLLDLAFSLTEVSIAVEIFDEAQVPYGYDPFRYVCTADGNPSLPLAHAK